MSEKRQANISSYFPSDAKRFLLDDDDDIDELEYYHSPVKKFYMDQHISRFIINDLGEYPEAELMKAIQKIIDRAFENTRKEGRNPKKFGLLINGYGLDSAICIPAREPEQNTIDAIMNEIDMLEISDKKFNLINNPISIIVTTLSKPEGAAGVKNFDAKNYFGTKALHRIKVHNNDNFCLFYALGLKNI